MSTRTKKVLENRRIPQNGELYDVDDFRLAIWELNRLGYDLDSSHVISNAHCLHLTCRKTNNRFVLECIGNNNWPSVPSLATT